MKPLLLTGFLLYINCAAAQYKNRQRATGHAIQTAKYFSFNPLSPAEPQFTLGIGFGNRFSARSEYFAELSYVAKNPVYGFEVDYLHGARFIAQYRYHFLHPWNPLLNTGLAKKRGLPRINLFIAPEFRIKPFSFAARRSFVRDSPADTLNNFLYKANAVAVCGAILLGSSYNISKNGKWQIELSAGIGARQKFVRYKNVPANYQSYFIRKIDIGPPSIDEAVSMPYFPCCMRIRYVIN